MGLKISPLEYLYEMTLCTEASLNLLSSSVKVSTVFLQSKSSS